MTHDVLSIKISLFFLLPPWESYLKVLLEMDGLSDLLATQGGEHLFLRNMRRFMKALAR